MKKRWLSILLSLALVLGMVPAPAAAATGESTPAGTITTQEELSAALSEGTGDYKLAGDVTVTDWTTPETEFTGTLDGQGHTITGLNAPLTGSIGPEGVVMDLTLDDAFIECKLSGETAEDVGALAVSNEGMVRNVHLTRSGLYGSQDGATGGLVGLNTGVVTQCSNQGGSTEAWSGIRKQQGSGTVGGVVGHNDGGLVDQCCNVDAVSSATGGHGMGSAGGVVGTNGNRGTVSHCYNRGDISNGTTNSGGIAGTNKDNNGVEGICTNSYHAGTVLGGNNNRVITTYGYISNGHYLELDENAGHPDRNHPETAWRDEPQALADSLNVVSDYFVIDGGALKLTWETGAEPAPYTASDKAELEHTLAGADSITQESGPYTDESWVPFLKARENAGFAEAYPFTTAEQTAFVTNALNSAYEGLEKVKAPAPDPGLTWTEVDTAEALKAALAQGGGVKLTADLTLGADWDSGTLSTAFVLEGAGHTITLNGTPLISTVFFGEMRDSVMAQGSTVQNVVFTGTVKGNEMNSANGAVAGTVQGTVRNCINRADVTASGMSVAGGFAGKLTGTLENCVGYGTVSGAGQNDALVGNRQGTITNSYGAEALTTADQRSAALEALNGAAAAGDQSWELSGDKLTFASEPVKPEATREALKARIDEAEKRQEADYVEETWTAFAAALTEARAVYADPQADASAIGRALAVLDEAEGQLVEKPSEPAVEVIEIASQAELEAALADLFDDPGMGTQAGKKLVLTADFTITGVNRARGLNTVLDGQGHTITLNGSLPVVDEIGKNGVVENLGVTGSIKGDASGAITNKCAGRIVNCWSTASIERTTAGAIGGLTGSLLATGSVENCYVAADSLFAKNDQSMSENVRRLVGPLVGTAREGSTITNSYWRADMVERQVLTPYYHAKNEFNESVDYPTPGCGVKTLDELKAPAFIALLNENHAQNMTWVQGENGLPVHGEAQPEPEVQIVEIASADEFNAAMSDVWMDPGMADHAGKQFVITADFTYTGTMLPEGLNAVLDGQGHTITLISGHLLETIGPDGVVKNLGLIGLARGDVSGAMTPNCYGRIENCWSMAGVKNTGSATIGGLVGTLRETGSIANCYVIPNPLSGKNVGALVGTVRPGSTITHGYWLAGTADKPYFRALDEYDMPVEYTGASNCSAKSQEELKAPAFLALLNENRGEGMQWNRAESGYPYFGAHFEPVELIEIADKDQFYAALANLIMDDTMSSQKGKKLVITDDFTLPYESFRMPVGLNTVLEGNGHTITLDRMCLVDEIGPKGVIQNLGVVGIADGNVTGAFAPKSAGRIVNCWSNATVKNTGSAAVGGLVGSLLSTGSIENSYVAADLLKGSLVGGLVGTARQGSTLVNSYWKLGNGDGAYARALDDSDLPIEYTGAAGCSAKTEAELKSAEFLALLNANRGENDEWTTNSNGYPHLGEAGTVDPVQGVEITLTYKSGKEVRFSSADGLVVDLWDLPAQENVGTLSCEGGAHWSIDYDTYGKNIMVADSTGALFLYGAGEAVVSVADSAWEPVATFRISVPARIEAEALRLTAREGTVENGVLTVAGSTTINLVPQIRKTADDAWVDANDLLFTFEVSRSDAATVVGNGVTPSRPGRFTIVGKGMGLEATLEVESKYQPITRIYPSPSGEYVIHGRHAMVFEKSADFLDLNLSHGAGSVIVEPENASYKGEAYYDISYEPEGVLDYVADFVKGFRPLRAGTTTITVKTNGKDPNQPPVEGSSVVTITYRNPVADITIPTETVHIKEGEKRLLPISFIGEHEGHVTEPMIDWTFSGDGKVVITRPGMGISEHIGSENTYVANDQYFIEGVVPGTVTVTGTPWDQTNHLGSFSFTVNVEKGDGETTVDYDKMAAENVEFAANWTAAHHEGDYLFGHEWEVFTLTRTGHALSRAQIDRYLDSIYDTFKDPSALSADTRKPTTQARAALALAVLGEDITQFRGTKAENAPINFAALLLNNPNLTAGSNELAWTLIALDTKGFDDAGYTWSRDRIISELLSYQTENGSIPLTKNSAGNVSAVDTTGMAVQALAPYYDRAEVKAAVDKALGYLAKAMDDDCGYGSVESAAQVLTALTALKLDPTTHPDFSVGRKNLITNINSYRNEEGEFTFGGKPNAMSTIQALYSMESYLLFKEGKSLYILTDMGGELTPADAKKQLEDRLASAEALVDRKDTYTEESWAALETAMQAARNTLKDTPQDKDKLIAADNTLADALAKLEKAPVAPDPEAPKITVSFTLYGAKRNEPEGAEGPLVREKWVEKHYYTLPAGSTNADLFKLAMEEADLQYRLSFGGNYVSGVERPADGELLSEFDNGPNSGWKYMVDGIHPNEGLAARELKDGQEVIWHYVNDYTTDDSSDLTDRGDGSDEGGDFTKPEGGGDEFTQVTRPDGTVVETTKRPDGTIIVVEKRPDGSVTTKMNRADGSTSVTETDKNGRTEAQVTIPEQAIKAAQKADKPVLLPLPALDAAGAPVIRVDLDGGKNVTVKVPVEDLTPGTVAVIVRKDGSEEVIRKTAMDRDGILFTLEESANIRIVDRAKQFADTIPAWAEGAVAFVTARDLFAGTGSDTFSADVTMSRAMLAAVLWRLEGEPRSSVPGGFADVAQGTWYTGAVDWAAEHSIVSGTGNGFAPDAPITRQELASMMFRYADFLGLDTSARASTARFHDASEVAPWAQEAMEWAVASGLIVGRGGDLLAPTGTATRAETASILQRMVDLLAR